LATFFSFLWPGLGQLYVGARRAALIFGLPLLVVLVVVALQALSSPEGVLIGLFTPSTALTVLILIVLFGAWRLISMGDALGTAGRRGAWRKPVPLASFLVLAAIVITTHAAAASLAYSFYDAGRLIFVGEHDPDGAPLQSPLLPTAPAASLAPGETAAPSDPVKPARINILLTGIEHG